jgi:membrane protein YqaA with SNARE-associated domain
VARIAALAASLGITVYVYSVRSEAAALAAYGLPGIFLLSLLSNATVILPAPGLALVFAFGGVLDPLAVAVAAGAGAALGEITGYLAGYSGRGLAAQTAMYASLERFTRRYGGWAIASLAFIPNPFFDIAGASAGVLRMPLSQFLLWTFLGKTLKMLLIAYAGAASLDWLEQYL